MNQILLMIFFTLTLVLPLKAYSVTSFSMCADITDLEVDKNSDGTFDITFSIPTEDGRSNKYMRIYFSGSNLESRTLDIANNLKTCYSAVFYHPAPQPNQMAIISTYKIKLKPPPPISRAPVIRK
ncbi:MAG: hypothetical protein HYW85_01755 [Deltaproteobacteria bacterium]|nr:hypothetical protein [Deltaproteobacteria bacterium]MBI3017346.1 hypothetical protein [Deltaproteobacteria bacterium]